MRMDINSLTEHYSELGLGGIVEELQDAITTSSYFTEGVLKEIRDGSVPRGKLMESILCAHSQNYFHLKALQGALENHWKQSIEGESK